MTSVEDMRRELSDLTGVKITSVYSIYDEIEELGLAQLTAEYLAVQIDYADSGINPSFCPQGTSMLRNTYKKLREKFPDLQPEERMQDY